MTVQVLINGIAAAAPIALVAVGMSLVFSVGRVFHLAHAFVLAATPYAALVLLQIAALPRTMSFLLALFVGTATGTAIELLVYRPLRRRGAEAAVLMLASFGVLVLGQGCLSLTFGETSRTLRSPALVPAWSVLGGRLSGVQLLSVVISAFVCMAIAIALRCTRAGTVLRAVASDSELAVVLGVRQPLAILVAFLIASATGGVAGMLVAYQIDLSPTMGFHLLLVGLTAAIVGGLGSLEGAVLGALLIGLAQHMSAWVLPTQWQDMSVFTILMGFLLLRPQGLLGAPRRRGVL